MMSGSKRTLVTGGAGFIGSHLVEFLLGNSFLVDVVDDLSNGSRCNISQVSGCRECNLHEINLDKWLTSTYSDQQFDMVFHLASPVGVSVVENLSQREFEKLEEENRNLIDWAFHHSEKLCVSSSSEVYGDLGDQQNKITMDEDSALDEFPAGKRWRYARLKRKMEMYALETYRYRLEDLFIARLFNVVGERQNSDQGMVLPTFVKAVRDGNKITIFGDGSQQRCFSDVRDVVEILWKGTISENAPAVLNIGTESPLTLGRLAGKVKEIGVEMGFTTSEIVYEENRMDEIFRRVPDTNRLQHWLGSVPAVDIDSVIRRTFEDQGKNLKAKNDEVVA